MSAQALYPMKVEAHLDQGLSRWLWLVKWFLAIPHFIILAFLWIAYTVLSVIAFFSILFTGRYPRGIFEFNLGVLRWSWRVSYYSFGAFGTDRYPPFTLAEVADYPAHLEMAYPERLSRGLVLVKWWLLAIPHYLIIGVFMGGTWFAGQNEEMVSSPGLIGILAFIAAVVLTITGRYPRDLFNLVLGLNRWVLRVAAYAGLMTDAYPPFRLDMGEEEPGGRMEIGQADTVAATAGGVPSGAASTTAAPVAAPAERSTGGGWSGGATAVVIIGSLISLFGFGFAAGGVAAYWLDETQREDGFLTSPTRDITTGSHALVGDEIDLTIDEGPDAVLPSDLVGDARVRVTPIGDEPVFVGIARTADVDRYLDGVGYATVHDFEGVRLTEVPGGAPDGAPGDQSFWTESRVGTGTQTLTWPIEEGVWSIVVMNQDGAETVAVSADVGAEVPVLGWIARGLMLFGGLVLLAGLAMVVGTIRSNR